MNKIILIITLITIIMGCGLAQKGALIKAYDNYNEGDYDDVIKYTSNAEKYKEPSPEMKAEILYLRALALEKLERHDEAQGTFKFLYKEFGDTEYGYRAKEKIK